jgi:ATP-dependent Zn protease
VDQHKLKIAYHETGHAVMALICRQRIYKVSLKEMDSPLGTDKYLGYTKLEPFEQKASITINESIRRVRIALGGYASECLFLGGSVNVGCDDLTRAIKSVESMMQSEEFRNVAATLPVPEPDVLHIVENPTVRAFINYQIHLSIKAFEPCLRQIQLIAEKLYEREELTGDEISSLFN